jgi:hypothetical protein
MRMGGELKVGLCGAGGGAINAWLCYTGLPVAIEEAPDFRWHVIPAGAIHGGLLAAVAFGVGQALWARSVRTRMAAALPLAWMAGYVSWIPLNWSAFDRPWAESLNWPFESRWSELPLGLLQQFGFVALFYYAAVAMRLVDERRLSLHVAGASAAGILGSLWWWTAMEVWYFSLLHGAIWGTCVGVGAWAVVVGAGPPAPSRRDRS